MWLKSCGTRSGCAVAQGYLGVVRWALSLPFHGEGFRHGLAPPVGWSRGCGFSSRCAPTTVGEFVGF